MSEIKFLSLLGIASNPQLLAKLEVDLQESDQLLMKILLGHWAVASTLMAYAYGFYWMGLIGGGMICGIAYVGAKFFAGTIYPRLLMGACLMLFSALFIQQNLGRIEIHFHIFCALALLLRYKSLWPIVAAVVTVASHHLIANYCQSVGVELFSTPVIIFDYGFGLGIVFLHAAFVVFEAIFLGYIVITLTRQFCESAQNSIATLEVLDTLDTVIQTRDTSCRMDDSNEHAHVVNALLDMINGQVAVEEAMQKANTGLVIVDVEGSIMECNDAARTLFDAARSAYAKLGVGYDSAHLVGNSVLPFLAVSDHRLDITSLSGTQRSEFTVGDRSLRVLVNPVINQQGRRLGAVLEWEDATAQVAVEREVQDIVDAAQDGDLSRRVNVSDTEGFLANLSTGVNALLGGAASIIDDTVEVLGAMAQGDLTKTIEGDYRGQFEALQVDANSTIEKLTEVVNDIQRSADSLSASSAELADTNLGLSRRTEEQIKGIEQAAATMEEMAASVKQTADHARQASTSGAEVRQKVDQSKVVVDQAVGAMAGINQASDKIGNIIEVINDIAFQTNLLALNAAIEAARAGEEGRGFAVVANEVRELAGRSANAAKEIKELIDHSRKKVAEGTEHVQLSGEALAEIVESVTNVTNIIEEIAVASEQQANGIGQVNQAISQMEQATQQNAAMVAMAAEASNSTGQEADQLKQMMAFFTLSRVK